MLLANHMAMKVVRMDPAGAGVSYLPASMIWSHSCRRLATRPPLRVGPARTLPPSLILPAELAQIIRRRPTPPQTTVSSSAC
jgi:hypothetical protein